MVNFGRLLKFLKIFEQGFKHFYLYFVELINIRQGTMRMPTQLVLQ